MNFLIALLFSMQQDTLPAIIKLQHGNYTKQVKGYVVLNKDCKAVAFIRINTWKRKEKLLPFNKKDVVVDWRLCKQVDSQ
jgi:hypothetical protein